MNLYLDLIVKRASGELKTAASWMRDFVRSHPDYEHDSVVPESTAYDLLKRCHDVGVGAAHEPELLGPDKIAPIFKENAYNVQLSRVNFSSNGGLVRLLASYAERARLVTRGVAPKNDPFRSQKSQITTSNGGPNPKRLQRRSRDEERRERRPRGKLPLYKR